VVTAFRLARGQSPPHRDLSNSLIVDRVTRDEAGFQIGAAVVWPVSVLYIRYVLENNRHQARKTRHPVTTRRNPEAPGPTAALAGQRPNPVSGVAQSLAGLCRNFSVWSSAWALQVQSCNCQAGCQRASAGITKPLSCRSRGIAQIDGRYIDFFVERAIRHDAQQRTGERRPSASRKGVKGSTHLQRFH